MKLHMDNRYTAIYESMTRLTQVTLQKEAIQWEIKEQMKLGEAGLLEEDFWMTEVNFGDLESTSG